MKKLPFVILFCWFSNLYALEFTLCINKDTTTISALPVSGCSFNSTPDFNFRNESISLDLNDTLKLHVINNDTLPHTFTIDGILTQDNEIPPLSSDSFSVSFSTSGSYRYYSDKPYGKMIGASGIISVGYSNFIQYFWNLYDLENELSNNLAAEIQSEIPFDYNPELFFINGLSFPSTVDDSATMIHANVGDEIIVSIVNSGNMDHVLHFHGFHVEVLEAKISSKYTGWIKDTFPVKCQEAMTVKLVPHQVGIYPVHDHNLIAVTEIGFYPGGMLTLLNIEQ